MSMIPPPPLPTGDPFDQDSDAGRVPGERISVVAPPKSAIVEATPAGSQQTTPSLRWYRRWLRAIGSGLEWCFGLASVIVGLSVLATIPVLQFLSLGYLLEVCGRVARERRLSHGFIGIRHAARIGSVALGTWVVLWPARAVSGLWYSSLLLNGDNGTTRGWRVGLIAIVIATLVHTVWAWLRGGRLIHFLWPSPRKLVRRLKAGGIYREARDRFWQFIAKMRLGYYFQLGLRGALATFVWLSLPVTLMVLAPRLPVPIGGILGLLGGCLLATVLIYLPFLQVRFAASNQFGDLFDVRSVRASFQRAPIAFWISLLATLALALPLYLLKAELLPREAVWLPSIVFIVFSLPARWLSGWAIARAEKRAEPRHALSRWLSRLAFIPVVMTYVLVVYFTRYISWYGGLSLYEQHAFLLPVPFLSF